MENSLESQAHEIERQAKIRDYTRKIIYTFLGIEAAHKLGLTPIGL